MDGREVDVFIGGAGEGAVRNHEILLDDCHSVVFLIPFLFLWDTLLYILTLYNLVFGEEEDLFVCEKTGILDSVLCEKRVLYNIWR